MIMQYGKALLQRFGLFAPKTETMDAFDMRLQRMEAREKRLVQKPILFKPSLQLAEA
jgi:hypothetical protein